MSAEKDLKAVLTVAENLEIERNQLKDESDQAVRLLGFALFNLNKGKYEATETLMRKAYKALAGKEWDGQ